MAIGFPFASYSLEKAKQNNTETLYFMGLKNNSWFLFYRKLGNQTFSSIKTSSEPREIYFSVIEKTIFYLDAETKLRQLKLDKNKEETIIFTPSQSDSYAQPFWDKNNQLLYMVKMPHGKSSEADIVVWNGEKMSPIVLQISSQFEPFISNKKWLYYGHVHCSLNCGHIIQEIWRKNLISGEAEQLTLLGQISRQAVVDKEGKWMYFSSNKQGTYQIWRQSVNGEKHTLEQISNSDATDSDPAISSKGQLFFIRHKQNKAYLMLRKNSGNIQQIPLPEGVSEIRNLRINN